MPHLVSGTTDGQRRSLGALGGVARELAGSDIEEWPTAIRSWVRDAPLLPTDLAKDVRAQIERDDRLLEQVYETLVSGRERRRLGTFFTPLPIAAFLVGQAYELIGHPKSVIDPGAGIGAISLAAKRQWPEAQVYAVDVNIVTLGLLAALCVYKQIGGVNLVHDDYLRWVAKPPTALPRLIIGNPPYTRHQELPRKLDVRDRETSGDAVTSGLASLSAYFVASSVRALGPKDALVFVLPGSWTEACYGAGLRKLIWREERRLVTFFPFPADSNVFPGTNVNTVVLSVGPERATQQFVTISSARIEPGRVRTEKAEYYDRGTRKSEELGKLLWFRLPSVVNSSEECIALEDIAGVRRGVATGANSFFFLTETARRLLPQEATVPAIVQLRHSSGDVYDEEAHAENSRKGIPCWLLRLEEGRIHDGRVQALISKGEEDNLPESRYLLKHRKPWYRLEAVPPPDIMVSSMARDKFQVVENAIRAVPSNSIYGIYSKCDGATIRALAIWLRGPAGQQALRAAARHYGSGLHKLEPRALLGLRIPKAALKSDVVASPNEEVGRTS